MPLNQNFMKHNVYKSSAKIILGDSNSKDNGGGLPNQRVSRRVKNTKDWKENSLDFFITNRNQEDTVRKTSSEIQSNWEFYNSVLSPNEIKKHLDPLNVEEALIDDDMKSFEFYDILHQPFDTLFGEELKRISDVKAYAINPNVINQKDTQFKDQVVKYLNELVEQQGVQNQEEFQAKLKELDHYRKHDLQSAHEEMINQILESLKNDTNLNLKYKFNKGFKNLEIVGEQIYRIGNIGNNLSVTNVMSEDFSVLGMGSSEWIQDGTAWIEVDHMNVHKVIEEFAEELTNKEIDTLLNDSNKEEPFIMPMQIQSIPLEGNEGIIDPNKPIRTTIPMDQAHNFISINGEEESYDENGNLRVYRVQWLSLRKLGKLKYYDEQGDEQYKWVDEYYVTDVTQGEEIKWIWVNELWEGCRLGNDIYKKIRVSPIQMRSITNPAIVYPSYVGYVISEGGKNAQCRIDRLKPYQRLYNTTANKLIKLFGQDLGKVGVVDVSRIPSDMDTDEWYVWLKRYKLMFENSFEEGKKGIAKGQLAGNMNRSSGVIDLSLGTEINQLIETLNWIENRVNTISAVPEPRQGALTGNEGLGTTQQAISSSSNQTHFDFFVHDLIQSKVYEIAVEYIKVLWKDEKGKRQYVLDDLSEHIIEINGELLNEAEFGITITNSSKLYEMFNSIKQLSHAAMQTGTATLSDIARLNMATSPSEMLRRLEEAEDKRQEQAMEQSKMQQEAQQGQMQAAKELEQLKHQQELEKLKIEWGYKMQEKQMELSIEQDKHSRDMNENGIEDEVELETERIKGESDAKLQDDKFQHEKEIQDAELKNKIKLEHIKGKNKSSTINKSK